MAAPDPEGFSLLSKVLAAAAAILVPVGGVYKFASAALAKKADKEQVDDFTKEMKESFETHRKEDRENFIKLFENAESDRTMVREGFAEVLREMRDSEIRLRDKIDAKASR